MIQFSPHFPFLQHVTRLSTHYLNCFWLIVLYMIWLSDANHLPWASMPNPYLTHMTQILSPCLLISASAFGHLPDPWPSATYRPCTILRLSPSPLVPKTMTHCRDSRLYIRTVVPIRLSLKLDFVLQSSYCTNLLKEGIQACTLSLRSQVDCTLPL